MLQLVAEMVVALQLIQAAVLQLAAEMVAALLLTQAAVLQLLAVQHVNQHAVHQQVAVTAVATDVVAEAAASRCQNSVAQKSACQSCVAQRSACLSATSVAAADADAVHHAVHLVAQLANQAAVHQLQLHVLALATDIKSAKG